MLWGMQKTIVLATSNQGKVKEFVDLLVPIGYKVISLKEAGIISNPVENGLTYKENCFIKAHDASLKTDFPVLADDSGIEIEAMGNKPGVHTARYAQEQGGFPAVFNVILDNLKGKDNRKAAFHCCLCLIPGKDEDPLFFEGVCPGEILFEAKGTKGFGYDPIFHSYEANEDFGTANEEIKNKYSHRGKAAQKLKDYLLTK